MAEDYLNLSPKDRHELLQVVAAASGRPSHIIEKDIWVVWALSALFESPFGKHLVFKGGTSLSKVYRAIRRFSEDIDVTYDIRAFAPDLVEGTGEEALPPTSSQEKKWSKAIRKQLPTWVAETALPYMQTRLAATGYPGQVRVNGDCLYIEYEPNASGYGYVQPSIFVEFGARSTGEPATVHDITCDASEFQPEVRFPIAAPRVMNVERTFWEKATAVHVFCLNGKIKDRRARHWYDITKLDNAGFAESAIKNRAVAQAVARHKTWFFEDHDTNGAVISYFAAIDGGLILVPQGEVLTALATDYEKMVNDGLLLDEVAAFEGIIDHCRKVQDLANTLAGP